MSQNHNHINKNNKKNNNNNNNNNNYYELIYNNIYINNNINNHLTLYDIFQSQRNFNSAESFQNFKYKQYLSCVFIQDFNNQFDLTVLPSNIQSISFRGEEIKSDIQSNIKTLKILGLSKYNWSVLKQAIHLETLFLFSVFGIKKISQFKATDLPNSITDLYIDTYEYPITKETLPDNIKKLEIVLATGDNLPIEPESLPESITYLKLTISTDIHPLQSHYFPNSLLKLDLSENSLEQLPNDFKLPNSITSLKLNCGNLPTSFKFPSNLKSLELYTNQLKEDEGPSLPQSLEKLHLVTHDKHPATSKILPRYLKKLKINCSTLVDSKGSPILSNTIQHLTLTSSLYGRNDQIPFKKTILPNMLPNSLTYLCLDDRVSNSNSDDDSVYSIANGDVLPVSLTHIRFGVQYNENVNLSKLVNCRIIEHGFKFNQPINYSNLTKLESLRISNQNYNQFPLIVPKFTKVDCRDYYKQFEQSPLSLYTLIIPISLYSLDALSLQNKSNLEYLYLSYGFKGPIKKEELPIQNNIKTLVLSAHYYSDLSLDYFPKLEILELSIASRPTLISTINHNNLKSIIVPGENVQFLNSIADTPFQKYLNIKHNN